LKRIIGTVLTIILIAACGAKESTTPSTIELAPVVSVETTTTTSTTSTTTTTTTIPRVGKCAQWHNLAVSVGWPEEELPQLDIVMWRESRCQPDAWNGADAGLMQINQIHTEWMAGMGWKHPEDMFDPANNLLFAYRLWTTSGWKPWSATSGLGE
jgi:hypothetical protein